MSRSAILLVLIVLVTAAGAKSRKALLAEQAAKTAEKDAAQKTDQGATFDGDLPDRAVVYTDVRQLCDMLPRPLFVDGIIYPRLHQPNDPVNKQQPGAFDNYNWAHKNLKGLRVRLSGRVRFLGSLDESVPEMLLVVAGSKPHVTNIDWDGNKAYLSIKVIFRGNKLAEVKKRLKDNDTATIAGEILGFIPTSDTRPPVDPANNPHRNTIRLVVDNCELVSIGE